MSDEQKAREIIDMMLSLKGADGVDRFFSFEEDDLDVEIRRYGKKLLHHKINMDNLREQTLDEVSYVVLNSFGF